MAKLTAVKAIEAYERFLKRRRIALLNKTPKRIPKKYTNKASLIVAKVIPFLRGQERKDMIRIIAGNLYTQDQKPRTVLEQFILRAEKNRK